jgi:TRAP-type transport system small permease protein
MLMLLVMVFAMGYQVFGRYVLGRSPAWAEELARYLMVWLTFLGAAAVLREGGHLTVTALFDALPDKGKRALLWIRDAGMLGVCLLMAVKSWQFAMLNLSQETAAMEIPMTIPNLAMAVGFALLSLQLVLARVVGQPFKALAGDEF